MVRADTLRASVEADDFAQAKLGVLFSDIDDDHEQVRPAKKFKNIALERVRVTGAVSLVKTKIAEMKIKLTSDHNATVEVVAKMFAEGFSFFANDNEAKIDFAIKMNAAVTQLSDAEDIVASILADMAGSHLVEDLCREKTDADHVLKGLSKGPCKKYRLSFTQFNKVLKSIDRDKTLADAAAANVEQPLVVPPFDAIMYALAAEGNINVSASFFEAKSGLRGALVAPLAGTHAIQVIEKFVNTKKAMRDLASHLKSNQTRVLPITDVPAKRKLLKELRKSFDVSLFSQLVLPQQDWTPLVYDPQYFASTVGWVQVGYTHMCCCECRVMLKGDEVIMCFSPESIAGITIKDKRKNIFAMTIDDVKRALNRGGFLIAHDSTNIAVLPSGYIYVTCSSVSRGLRWSFSSDEADTQRVKMDLTLLIQCCPEFGNSSTGYSQLLAWLNFL